MSALRIYNETDTANLLFSSSNNISIHKKLAEIGVRFEQWLTKTDIQAGASADDVLHAYQADIDALIAKEGYQTFDVISLNSSHPQKAELRQKFLSEHTHSEDEVRFFVAGEGLFTLHINKKIYQVLCRKGDLISVPANTSHWFDMGPNPNFVAIRFFNNPEGWVANFTGSNIADRYNRLEN